MLTTQNNPWVKDFPILAADENGNCQIIGDAAPGGGAERGDFPGGDTHAGKRQDGGNHIVDKLLGNRGFDHLPITDGETEQQQDNGDDQSAVVKQFEKTFRR